MLTILATGTMPLVSTLAVGLTAALIFGVVLQRLGFSPILGYLLAGVAIGPHTPGFVGDVEIARQLAEVGVILLMFGVGLHFSVRDLWEVRGIAITGALTQSICASALGVLIGVVAGWGAGGGLVFGLAISVASTVVLLRELLQHRLLENLAGRVAIGWLIVEDLFTVLVLVVLPSLAPAGGQAESTPLGSAILDALLRLGLLGLVAVVAARVLPRALALVARLGSRELFTLAVLGSALGIAYASAELFGVSMALGAFLGGLLVAQSDLSHQAAADALPLRDAFAVLFFLSIGMLFDPQFAVTHPGLVLAALGVILLGKPASAILLAVVFRQPVGVALTVGIGLAQIGEFSFILAALGHELGLLPEAGRQTLVAAALFSIALNPFLFRALGPLEAWLRRRPWARKLFGRAPRLARPRPVLPGVRDHAIVCGHGRVGSVLTEMLRARDLPVVIVEQDRRAYERLRAGGAPAVYGDAASEPVLAQTRPEHARVLLVTFADPFAARAIVAQARHLNPKLPITVRVHSEQERQHFAGMEGVSAVMAELEVALEMGRTMLETFGVGTLAAQATVIEKRRGLGLRDAEVETMAVDVAARSPAVGKTIAQLGLGQGALVVAIVRDGRLLVPAGPLQLLAGDRLLLIADREARNRIGEAF